MNFFGLARRSVFRKPIKSILLLLIVFAISTLLLAGVASKNASIEVQDKTRQAIGAGFLLERNAEYRTKRVREYSEKIGNDKEGSFWWLPSGKRDYQWCGDLVRLDNK